MPDRLRNHPWLGEFYGSYKHAIPAIFAGYLGWYQGDPVSLDPTPWTEKASRYIKMMGGRNKLIAAAQSALSEGDAQWAAELSTWLIRVDHNDTEARALKSEALRCWAYEQKNATWRNWALSSAMELDGDLDLGKAGMVLGSPDQVQGFPLSGILKVMTVRLKPEVSWDTHMCVALETTDSKESCALEIRGGVCQFYELPPSVCDTTIKFDRAFLLKWIFGQITFREALEAGSIVADEDNSRVADFFDKFEPFNQVDDVRIAAR